MTSSAPQIVRQHSTGTGTTMRLALNLITADGTDNLKTTRLGRNRQIKEQYKRSEYLEIGPSTQKSQYERQVLRKKGKFNNIYQVTVE